MKTAIKNNSASTSLQKYSSANMPESSLISAEQLIKAVSSFGPDFYNMVFCHFTKPQPLSVAVESNSPTFREISSFFSEEATSFLLRFHIAETFAFLGIYDTASKHQIQQTADLILSHPVYGQFTITEFLCFLGKFKMGEYGKIYQSARPNPQEFLMCLKPFWEELSRERIKQEEREYSEQLSRERRNPDSMTYEEYKEIEMITKMYEMDI